MNSITAKFEQTSSIIEDYRSVKLETLTTLERKIKQH